MQQSQQSQQSQLQEQTRGQFVLPLMVDTRETNSLQITGPPWVTDARFTMSITRTQARGLVEYVGMIAKSGQAVNMMTGGGGESGGLKGRYVANFLVDTRNSHTLRLCNPPDLTNGYSFECNLDRNEAAVTNMRHYIQAVGNSQHILTYQRFGGADIGQPTLVTPAGHARNRSRSSRSRTTTVATAAPSGSPARRVISAAGRKRIAAAQRKRWANQAVGATSSSAA